MSLNSLNPTDVKKSQHRLTHLALCKFFLLPRDDKMGVGFTCPTSSQKEGQEEEDDDMEGQEEEDVDMEEKKRKRVNAVVFFFLTKRVNV